MTYVVEICQVKRVYMPFQCHAVPLQNQQYGSFHCDTIYRVDALRVVTKHVVADLNLFQLRHDPDDVLQFQYEARDPLLGWDLSRNGSTSSLAHILRTE